MNEKKENTKRLGVAASAALALALGGVCTSWAAAAAVTADYTNDFTYSNGANPTNFGTSIPSVGNATTSFKVQDNAFLYKLSAGTSGASGVAVASSAVQVSNLGGAATSALSFTFSSTLTLTGSTSISNSSTGSKSAVVGLAALGTATSGKLTDTTGADSSLPYYWANLTIGTSSTISSTLGRLAIAGGGVGSSSGSDTISINMGDTYQLTLTGTYVGSSLDLVFTVTDLDDLSNTVTVSTTDASPLTGNYFGYRARTTSGFDHTNINASFDDFSIALPQTAIPTPAALPAGLALLGLVGVSTRRRRA